MEVDKSECLRKTHSQIGIENMKICIQIEIEIEIENANIDLEYEYVKHEY